MRIIDCEQNTPDWFKWRVGIPTASNFDKIVTSKGEPSKQRTKYMYQLAGERITGKMEETYKNANMQRGIEMESEARQVYELINNVEILKVGLCIEEGETVYAASPDGLVGKDGLIEIKCPQITTHVEYLLKTELPTEYFQQVQGQLLVTNRKWNDFISYYPGMKPLIVRVQRDEKFIKALKIELEVFCKELNQLIERIK